MSTSNEESNVIDINTADKKDEEKCYKTSKHDITEPFLECYKKFKDCLHVDDKSAGEVGDRKAEREAYKKLMEDLEGEPHDQKASSVLMWIGHVVILVGLITFLVTTWNMPNVKDKEFLNLRVHSWVALLMVIVSGFPVIRFLTYAASEPLIWFRRTQKYTVYLARRLKMSVDITLWSALLFFVWYTFYRPQIVKDKSGAHIFHTSMDEYKQDLNVAVKQVTRLLMTLTIGAFLWTMKNALFHRLKADLHYADLCLRIRLTVLQLHAMQFIQNEGKWSFLTNSKKTKIKKGYTVTKRDEAVDTSPGLSFWMSVASIRKETTPVWILKRLTYTYLRHMKTDMPKVLQLLEDTNDDQELMKVARDMFQKIPKGRQDDNNELDISPKDLEQYELSENEMERVFELFATREEQTTREQRITQDQFLRWAVQAMKNCLGLKHIIESSERIFWKLNLLLTTIVISLVLVIWLLLSEIVTTAQLAILFAPVVSASFIFGKSLREIFDGVIFVFGMHPFDVGDRVIVDGYEMKVSKLNILTTIFIKYDTGVEAIYPNSELSTKSIINLDILPDQSDSVEFQVPIEAPEELIVDLQVKIEKTLDDDLTYTSKTTVVKKEISKEDMTIVVHFKYLVSYFSAETRAFHRSKILSLIVKLRKDLIKSIPSNQEEVVPMIEVISFKIGIKVKLSKIEELKNKIMCILEGYDQRLKSNSQVLFTEIDKCKITMDVRMRYPAGLFGDTDDKLNDLKKKVKEVIEQYGEVI